MSSFPIVPLPRVVIEPTVRDALREDLGRGGDVTTNAVIDADLRTRCALTARQPGRLAGLDAAQIAFELLSPSLHFEARLYDGADLAPGDVIAVIEGDARGILSAERVALNFLGHLSGVASTTYQLVEKIEGTRARICCTRKTTPGLRALEKYAVRAGGGVNHRFGLDDGILIKDNHVAVAGGIAAALARVRARTGHMVKVEIEVDTLEQLDEVLDHDVDAILLDNMPQIGRAHV